PLEITTSASPSALASGKEVQPPPFEAALRAEAPGIDQIREILFGALCRELERRLVRADVHTATRSKEIEQEARRRSEVLETHIRTEIAALASRVDHAYAEAADTLRNITRENREAYNALEKRVAKAEETGAGAQRELRSQMLEQAKSF